jgi:hypothetical protein
MQFFVDCRLLIRESSEDAVSAGGVTVVTVAVAVAVAVAVVVLTSLVAAIAGFELTIIIIKIPNTAPLPR